MAQLDGAATGRARVVRDHAGQYADPIRVQRGQVVSVGREDDEYPGWWWCTGPDGRTGWVPTELLRMRGAVAEVLDDYDATELTVQKGQEVQVEQARRDWLWVCNATGEKGWIPVACVELGAQLRE